MKSSNNISTPSVTNMNKNFIIKWREYGTPDTGLYNSLIGAGNFGKKFGEKYAEKFFKKAWTSLDKKSVFKIRGKYIITFVAK